MKEREKERQRQRPLGEADTIQIVITTDRQLEETTSYVAGDRLGLFITINQLSCYVGGLWEPYYAGETSEELMKKWSKDTYEYYSRLYCSSEASHAGILQIPVYNLSHEEEVRF